MQSTVSIPDRPAVGKDKRRAGAERITREDARLIGVAMIREAARRRGRAEGRDEKASDAWAAKADGSAA